MPLPPGGRPPAETCQVQEAAERASPPPSSDLASPPRPAAAVGGLSREELSPHAAAHPRSGAHAPRAPGIWGARWGQGASSHSGARDLCASARRAAVAVTQGAGEGAELVLLTAVLEQGGRKLGRRGGGEVGVGTGGGRCARDSAAGGLGHVMGRRPRYRLTVGVTSPSPDCRGWHFRSLPHLFCSLL